ncbi:MAG: peptidyl-tRNA hydrolase [Oscillospiraceae bacterium]|jgi:PTH2 family peptidyl-tRNA hydrolase|nr:peptidyl-tRNA hydrolase [Oscillospiraceae bacterium]
MRQLIIARKDLQMSPGKLAAQVSHASMAFLSNLIRNSSVDRLVSLETGETGTYNIQIEMRADVYDDWLCGIFTKTICEARNRNHLMKAVTAAEELGLNEGTDFFLIKDNCLTELEPEEVDENGVGRTLTCIGFRPLPDEMAHAISRKYQLYR